MDILALAREDRSVTVTVTIKDTTLDLELIKPVGLQADIFRTEVIECLRQFESLATFRDTIGDREPTLDEAEQLNAAVRVSLTAIYSFAETWMPRLYPDLAEATPEDLASLIEKTNYMESPLITSMLNLILPGEGAEAELPF